MLKLCHQRLEIDSRNRLNYLPTYLEKYRAEVPELVEHWTSALDHRRACCGSGFESVVDLLSYKRIMPVKIQQKYSEYTRIYVLVKSVQSKVSTALAYDVARSSVGCRLRCRPRHLTRVLNYEEYVWMANAGRKRS